MNTPSRNLILKLLKSWVLYNCCYHDGEYFFYVTAACLLWLRVLSRMATQPPVLPGLCDGSTKLHDAVLLLCRYHRYEIDWSWILFTPGSNKLWSEVFINMLRSSRLCLWLRQGGIMEEREFPLFQILDTDPGWCTNTRIVACNNSGGGGGEGGAVRVHLACRMGYIYIY